METMTIRKANAERKDIDKRLESILRDKSTRLIAYYSNKKPLIGTYTPDEMTKRIESTYQSITDLIKRREKLNKAVLAANANTMVKVPKFVDLEGYDPTDLEEISIAAAINRKKYYQGFLTRLLAYMKNELNNGISNYDMLTSTMNNEFERNVTNQFGITSTQSSKARLEYAEAIKDDYKVTLINPLNLEDKIEDINTMILDYVRDIDSIISNACENTNVTIE